jgi:hypothetical protein
MTNAYNATFRLTEEVVAGLRLYFNKSLGNNLLYRFERGQYSDMMRAAGEEAEGEMSGTYGAEHLLRLFGEQSRLVDFDDHRLTGAETCQQSTCQS